MLTYKCLYSSSVIVPSRLYFCRSLFTFPFSDKIGLLSNFLYVSSFDRCSLHFSLYSSQSITTNALPLSAGAIFMLSSPYNSFSATRYSYGRLCDFWTVFTAVSTWVLISAFCSRSICSILSTALSVTARNSTTFLLE